MTRNGTFRKRPGDEGLLLALACGCSVAEAARRAGLSRRTAFRRLQEDGFKREVDRARDELLGQAVGKLLGLAAKAAVAVLSSLSKGYETVVLSQRVAELEGQR